MGNAFLKELEQIITTNEHPLRSHEVADDVAHPVTNETITKYKKLITYILLRYVKSKVMGKEIGQLTQSFGKF